MTKAQQKSRLQRLVAPVDGSVQQLAIHTVGGVVESVRPLMVIVPNGALVVEARVRNKDAGFVRTGQPVVIKLEAFPFTRYGTIHGRITSISRDAIQDPKAGAYFLARVQLEESSIVADGARIALTPGLDTTCDIGIGKRRIIDYIISPIRQTSDEAGREK